MTETRVERQAPEQLTKADLWFNAFFHFAYVRCLMGSVRKGGLSFGASMGRNLKKLYKNQDDLVDALHRETEFYMTDYAFGASIAGFVLSLEQQRANELYETGETSVDPDFIRSIKNGLMAPLAGFGDTVLQAVLHNTATALAVPLAIEGNPLSMLIGFVGMVAIDWAVSLFCFFAGYNGGRKTITQLIKSDIAAKIVDISTILGMMMMGALACDYIYFGTKININGTPLDGILDGLVPGFWPLLFVFGCYFLLKKKHANYIKIMFTLIAVCVLLAILNII